MDESANKGLELNGRDTEIRKGSIMRRRERPSAAGDSAIKALEALELDGIPKSGIISRMVVEGYDTSHPRQVVEEALRQHFASRGIRLIHAYVPVVTGTRTFCIYALIYVNEEREAEALKVHGSDMGGRILQIHAYPFDENRLDRVFAPTKATDECLRQQRTLKVTGFDTSLSDDEIEELLERVFPDSGSLVFSNGTAFVYLCGHDAIENALKLSGSFKEGFIVAVTSVLPRIIARCGFSRASMLAVIEKSKTKKIKTTD